MARFRSKPDDSDLLTEDSGWTSNEEKDKKKSGGTKKTTKLSKKSPSRRNGTTKSSLADDERYPRSVYLFLLFLMSSAIPVMIIMHQVCSTGDSLVCTSFRTILRAVAPVMEFSQKSTKSQETNAKSESSAQSGTKTKSKEEKKERYSDLSWMKEPVPNSRVLTLKEIEYEEGKPLNLVILGHVFDVSAGDYYKPGSGYHGFVGRDGSRAFITGEFNAEGLVDNVDDLSSQDYLGLAEWIKFYFEKYKFVGYLKGRYFDSFGSQTVHFKNFRLAVGKAESAADAENDVRTVFPPCNIAWSQENGSKLWCTKQSGGIQRDWVGYPRRFYEANKEPRCACVHSKMLSDPRIRPYANCDPKSDTCVPTENEA